MNQSNIKSVISSYRFKITAAYAVVFLFQLFLLYPLHKSMDLPRGDETEYMSGGRHFALGIEKLGELVWSPAYKLLYSIITRLSGIIASVFFMKYLLTIGVTLLLFTFLTQILYKKLHSFSIALLLTLLWAMSDYNIHPQSGKMIYHFAALVFILALIYCNKSRAISILLLLLCVFIRLEYIFILVPYFIYSTVQFMKKKKQGKPLLTLKHKPGASSILVTALILSAVLIYISVNVTDWDPGTNRMWIAFQQHYPIAQKESRRFNVINPAINSNIIISQDFPGAHSLRDALFINPPRFIHHVLRNSGYLFKAVSGFISPSYSGRYIIQVMLLFIYAAYIFLPKGGIFISQAKNIFSGLADIRILSLIAPLALVPGLIVYARTSYVLTLMPILFLYMGILYTAILRTCDEPVYIKRAAHILIFLTLYSLFLNPAPFEQKKQRPTYEKIQKLEEIWPKAGIKLLGMHSRTYASYLGYETCSPIELLTIFRDRDVKSEKFSLEEAIRLYNPDAILVDRILLDSQNFDKDSLNVLDSGNWVMHIIGDEKIYFLKPH